MCGEPGKRARPGLSQPERGLPLLDERGHTLFLVWCSEKRQKQRAFVTNTLDQRGSNARFTAALANGTATGDNVAMRAAIFNASGSS